MSLVFRQYYRTELEAIRRKLPINDDEIIDLGGGTRRGLVHRVPPCCMAITLHGDQAIEPASFARRQLRWRALG